jgi:replicative DNA helicase
MYKQGARLIAIDYLQLIKVAKGPENRDEKIGDITKSLKGLFKELDIPGYVLCQLNRAIEGREGATPRMSDLRESGNIENDADGIWVITRPKGNDEPNFEVHCLKGRNTGIFKPAQLWINNDLQQIRSAEWRAES